MRQSAAFWCVMLLATVSGTALAQSVESVTLDGAKDWSGGRVLAADGRFARCTATRTSPGGGTLTLSVDRAKALRLGASHPAWALPAGGTATVRASVDKGTGTPLTAPVVAGEGIVLDLSAAPEMVGGLRNGRQLTIRAGTANATFPLGGARKALAGLTGCVDTALAAEAAKPPAPAAQPAPAPVPEPTPVAPTPAPEPAPAPTPPAPAPAPEPAPVTPPAPPPPAPAPAPEPAPATAPPANPTS